MVDLLWIAALLGPAALALLLLHLLGADESAAA